MSISLLPTWAMLGPPAARLPLALIILFGALGLAALLYLHQRGRRLQAGVDEQFKRFREEAVGLMDQIDALRQRHKTLPETDPDFTVPMAGATLVLYNQVSAELDRLWDHWLRVMEVWNQAEQRMRSASTFTFSARPTEEARKILEAGGVEALLRRSSACKAELDRLNLAHETASKALKEARAAVAEAERTTFDDPRFHEAAERARRELAAAEATLTADPIGAADRIETIRRDVASLREASQPPPQRPRVTPEGPSRTIFDDLFSAASQLQELAANLRLTDIVGMLIKGWVALWVLGLFLVILPILMPLILVFMGIVVIASGLRAFQHMSGPLDWGNPRQRRRRRWWW